MKVRSVGCEVACFQDDSERFAQETWRFSANCYRSGWRGWAPSAFAKSLQISVLINHLLSLIRTAYLFNYFEKNYQEIAHGRAAGTPFLITFLWVMIVIKWVPIQRIMYRNSVSICLSSIQGQLSQFFRKKTTSFSCKSKMHVMHKLGNKDTNLIFKLFCIGTYIAMSVQM